MFLLFCCKNWNVRVVIIVMLGVVAFLFNILLVIFDFLLAKVVYIQVATSLVTNVM